MYIKLFFLSLSLCVLIKQQQIDPDSVPCMKQSRSNGDVHMTSSVTSNTNNNSNNNINNAIDQHTTNHNDDMETASDMSGLDHVGTNSDMSMQHQVLS